MAELSTKQLKAIASLLQRGTVSASAKDADTSERQLYRWLREDDFRAELQRQQSELTDAAFRLLVAGASHAVATMRQIMDDTGNPAGIRLRAASEVLTNILRIREHSELTTRLTELEDAIATMQLGNDIVERSDPVTVQPKRIDYRLHLPPPPPGYADGDNDTD